MHFVELVAALAVSQYLFFVFMTGKARGESGLKAPAVTGDEGFERMYRVQMNSLEMLVAFLPALFLAASYWPAWLTSLMGLVYIIGRFIYWRAYVSQPSTRGLGFLLTVVSASVLLVLALLGILGAIIGL